MIFQHAKFFLETRHISKKSPVLNVKNFTLP